MKWVLCYQTQNDIICYQTNDSQSSLFMGYKKFLEYIDSFNILDRDKFVNELNKFETIFINIDTKEWKVYETEREKHPSFETLMFLNSEKKEEKTIIEKGREWIKKFERSKKSVGN